jgi:hypothetical protein
MLDNKTLPNMSQLEGQATEAIVHISSVANCNNIVRLRAVSNKYDGTSLGDVFIELKFLDNSDAIGFINSYLKKTGEQLTLEQVNPYVYLTQGQAVVLFDQLHNSSTKAQGIANAIDTRQLIKDIVTEYKDRVAASDVPLRRPWM